MLWVDELSCEFVEEVIGDVEMGPVSVALSPNRAQVGGSLPNSLFGDPSLPV